MCLLEPERCQSGENGLADEYKKPRSLHSPGLILINIYHLSAYTASREEVSLLLKPMGGGKERGGVARRFPKFPRDDSIYPAEQTRSPFRSSATRFSQSPSFVVRSRSFLFYSATFLFSGSIPPRTFAMVYSNLNNS